MSAERIDSALTLLLLAVVAVVCGLGACSERPSPRFPHVLHLAKVPCSKPGERGCLSCASCHKATQGQASPALAALCVDCHRTDQEAALSVLSTRIERPFGSISFGHERHLAMPELNGQCVPCHGGVVDATRPNLPPMSQCFTCHEHERQWNAGECAPCHARADLARVLPQTFLRHDASFARRHGQLAVENQALCQSCHAQAQCEGCHDVNQPLGIERRRPERVEQNFVHVGDFLSRHSIEARSQPSRCARCHTSESCDGCHLARGVSGNLVNGRNPHPPGWVGPNVNARSFHGTEARRDILSCASCHDHGAATNCIRCHKVGSLGGNPHPNGWTSARGSDANMCRYCHE